MENKHWSAKNSRSYLVIERSAGLNFNILSQIFAWTDSTDRAKAEYAVSSKNQICRHTWYVHGSPQLSSHIHLCCILHYFDYTSRWQSVIDSTALPRAQLVVRARAADIRAASQTDDVKLDEYGKIECHVII